MLQSLLSGLTVLISYIPNIIGALLVLLIGYIIARIVRTITTKLLQKLHFDDRVKSDQGGGYVERFSPQGSPARLVATVIFAVIMVFVLSSAIGTLSIPALTGFMALVLGYLPRVIAALLIFVVASVVAGAVKSLAYRAMDDTPVRRIVATGGPVLVMAIAGFMILTQLQIAPVIVTTTYIALIGSLALGAAIAFGLGGRDAAADLINSGYRRVQSGEPERAGTAASAQAGGIPGQEQRGEKARDTGAAPPRR